MDQTFRQPGRVPLPSVVEPDRDQLLAGLLNQAEMDGAIELKRKRLLIEQAAKQQVHEAEARATFTEPEIYGSVADLIEMVEDPDHPMIIHGGLLGEGDLATITGEAKQGKTTVVMNLAHCLSEGTPFLDEDKFKIERPYRVLVLDGEMSPALWAAKVQPLGGAHLDRIRLLPFRGHRLDLCTDFAVEYLIKQCIDFGAEVLAVDNFSKFAHSVENENDSVQINRFHHNLQVVQERVPSMLATILVHHAGHGGTRARGSSVFRDRPDVLWDMKESDPPVFKIEGRHGRSFFVRTLWDEATNKLTYRSGETPSPATEQPVELREKILRHALELSGEESISKFAAAVSSNRFYRDTRAAILALGDEGSLKITKRGRASYVSASPLTHGEEEEK